MTDEQLTIEHEETGQAGRYFAKVPGGEAELTYKLRDGVMAIDHTYTPDEARGRSVARKLTEHAVAEAQKKGLRIDPVCPYVDKLFDRKPEWASLRA